VNTAAYIDQVFETIKKRNAGEPEFLQAVTEVFRSDHAGFGPASRIRRIAASGPFGGTGTRLHVPRPLAG